MSNEFEPEEKNLKLISKFSEQELQDTRHNEEVIRAKEQRRRSRFINMSLPERYYDVGPADLTDSQNDLINQITNDCREKKAGVALIGPTDRNSWFAACIMKSITSRLGGTAQCVDYLDMDEKEYVEIAWEAEPMYVVCTTYKTLCVFGTKIGERLAFNKEPLLEKILLPRYDRSLFTVLSTRYLDEDAYTEALSRADANVMNILTRLYRVVDLNNI